MTADLSTGSTRLKSLFRRGQPSRFGLRWIQGRRILVKPTHTALPPGGTAWKKPSCGLLFLTELKRNDRRMRLALQFAKDTEDVNRRLHRGRLP